MTRPLSSSKVEATGKSYSDHEALEVDLELSISNNKKSTASENKERVSCTKTYFFCTDIHYHNIHLSIAGTPSEFLINGF